MKVCAIMATCGRHTCSERSLGFFLAQDYPSKLLLIYNNSDVSQVLAPEVQKIHREDSGTQILLVNQHLDSQGWKPYTNLGSIYRDALRQVPEDVDVVCFWDDDDVFLPNHISQGVAGLLRTGAWAWKPGFSWMRYLNNPIEKFKNVFEPSIFVRKHILKKFGFKETTSDQHLAWVNGIIQAGKFSEDDNAEPTLVYDWSQEISTYKASGDPNNPNNFQNYRNWSNDHGDGIITPISPKKTYSQINKLIKDASRSK